MVTTRKRTAKPAASTPAPAKATAASSGSHLTAGELATLESILTKDLARAKRTASDLEDTLAETPEAQSRPGGDIADLAGDASAREQATMFGNRNHALVRELEGALRRLQQDPASFGKCMKCGNGIPMPRLELLPTTGTCLPCSRR